MSYFNLLKITGETKGERTDYLFKDDPTIATWDCAIPHYFLEKLNDRGFGWMSADFVTVYYKNEFSPIIMPITEKGIKTIAIIAANI